jgi:O-antigen/teichoic acid export membrane protein
MLITLYTSRVILQVLGVTDYGLYQVVGGVVGLISFINGGLSTGTARFLTYELGSGNNDKLNKTFCTMLNAHVILGVLIVILAETIGLWFVYNKLTIPPDRLDASVIAYHLSILTVFFSIIQIPYTASIIAYEKMHIYAYISIFEVLLKLLVVYLLRLGGIDRLILYALLLCAIQITMMIFSTCYCVRTIESSKYHFIFDKKIFKSVTSFSGWSLFAQASIALNGQGTTIITNMFFGPGVVTARAIALQVNMAANQFVNNFRTAINPQIVKKLAAGDTEGSKKLLLESTKYSYYLMFILGLPIILVADKLLYLWLGIVPEYSVIFLRLVIIQSLFSVFDTSFYTALYAKGRLRENALISPTIGFLSFPIVYILFKSGYSPVVLSYAGIVTYALLGFVVKPALIIKIADYSFENVMSVFLPCIKVTIIASVIPLLLKYLLDDSIFSAIIICFASVLSVIGCVYFVGIDKNIRLKSRQFIKNKLIKN